jgi:hypothetical protein
LLLVAALAVVALWIVRATQPAGAGIPPVVLTNGAASVDAVAERFVAALSARDFRAIEALRVDETEYRRLIMPGSVKPGQAPQNMPEKKSEYFWRSANTKSIYSLATIVEQYGGKPYRLKRVEVPRVDRFAWYTAHRDPILHLVAGGEDVELQLGTIAEYGGRFKFISYYSD